MFSSRPRSELRSSYRLHPTRRDRPRIFSTGFRFLSVSCSIPGRQSSGLRQSFGNACSFCRIERRGNFTTQSIIGRCQARTDDLLGVKDSLLAHRGYFIAAQSTVTHIAHRNIHVTVPDGITHRPSGLNPEGLIILSTFQYGVLG